MKTTRLFPEEVISLCRKIMNRTGYKDAPPKVKEAGWKAVFDILSFPEISSDMLDELTGELEMEYSEFEYYYAQCNLRGKP